MTKDRILDVTLELANGEEFDIKMYHYSARHVAEYYLNDVKRYEYIESDDVTANSRIVGVRHNNNRWFVKNGLINKEEV